MAHFLRYPRPSPLGRLRGRGYKLVVLLLFIRVLRHFQQFSVISRRCLVATGSSINAQFYIAASLKYHAPDTLHDTTPSHIILTLGRQVLALPPYVNLSAKRGAASTMFNDFGMSRPRIEPRTSRSPERTQISDAPEFHVCPGGTRRSIITIGSYFHHALCIYIYIY